MAANAFGLKNAPQIYQRLIDNALYGYIKIGSRSDAISTGSSNLIDVFTEGVPNDDHKPFVLGRKSYIDDILIPANSWTSLYDKVERLLKACDLWNLSISLAKSFWGRRRWIIWVIKSLLRVWKLPKRSRISCECAISSDFAIDAIVLGEFELLQIY